MRLSIVLCVILVAACSPAGLGAFDFVITDTYDHGTVELNNESLLVVGAGAYQVWARGSSYVEVQSTAPLHEFTGGIQTIDLDDNSSMKLYGGE